MNHTQQTFRDNYDILRTGINRIRFIKKRQIHNHNRIAEHLKQMIGKLSPKLEDSSQTHKQRTEECDTDIIQEQGANGKENVAGMVRSFTSRGKFKISGKRGKYALQPTQEDSSITKQSQDFEESRSQANLYCNERSTRKNTENNSRLKELLENKCANYREMKQHERQLEVNIPLTQTIRMLKTQENQRILKEKVMKAVKNKEQGRKKVEDNYFQYIEEIQSQKEKERVRRIRMTQKRHEDIIRLQEQQKKEIEMFQSSLALEQHLKSIIQRKLPIRSQQDSTPQQNWPLFS